MNLAQFSTRARRPGLSREVIEEEISRIQADFDFILILEHFDVSLAVLRQKIGWKLEDIQYLKINSISDIIKDERQWLGEDLNDNFKELNFGDMVLYERFNRSLWHQVEKIGKENILRDAKKLREMNRKLEKRCTDGSYKVNLQ